MLDDLRMIDRDVARSLLEIAHRVPSSLHHLAKQGVGESDRARRVVDEAGLDFGPALDEVTALGGLQRTDVQLLDALLAFGELRFGLRAAALGFHGAVVFRTEAVPKMFRPAPARPDNSGNDQNGDDDRYDDPCSLVHSLPPCVRRPEKNNEQPDRPGAAKKPRKPPPG